MILKKLSKRQQLGLIISLVSIVSILYLFWGLNQENYYFFIKRRIPKLIVMYLLSIGIGTGTIVFQTVTQNRILTPGILGIGSMYSFFNAFMIYLFSMDSIIFSNPYLSFISSCGFTIFGTLFIHKLIFSNEKFGIDQIILIGMIVGILLGSFTSLFQVILDPNEFSMLQDLSFASINNANNDLIYLAIPLIGFIIIYLIKLSNELDVLSLGRDHSINLGIDYDKVTKKMLLIVAIIISITTSLVGPMAFLGLITVNLAREICKTIKHTELITFTSLIGILILLFSQFVIEKFLNMIMPVGVLISFIGGFYFIILLIKESKNV